MNISPLQVQRLKYVPKLPGMLRHGINEICVKEGEETSSVADQEKIKALFPNTYGKKEITFEKGVNTSAAKKQVVGVILSGGQAPGGHNVVCGLYDALKATNSENVLYGFKGGPSGLLEDNYLVFDDEYINQFRNTGGFDIIGSGRTKLETEEQFAVAAEVCRKHGITAIVIIGGDDSNTNAAVLAEYFAAHNTGVQVIGCPKTIDGDLKNEDIECSFGFDTATKTYSELIGNIEMDMFAEKVQPLIPEDWLEELKLMSLRPFESIDGLQRDGAAIKACDLLGAWIEAYVSTQYGISSKILREAKVTIGRKLIDEKKGERIGVAKILEDFEKMEI